MNLVKLRENLGKRKNQIGLVGTRLNISQVEGNTMSAHITTDWKTIDMKFGRDLNLVPDKETEQFVKRKEINDPEMKVGGDILEHETGHRENPVGTKQGCPHTVEMHDAIKDSIHRALEEKGKKGLDDYVTNAFEDVLDNINCRRNTDFAGQTLFWNNQGLVNNKDGHFAPFYEAFVRINLMLGGSLLDSRLLQRFYGTEQKVKNAVKGFLTDMKSRLGLEYSIKLHEKPQFKTLFTRDIKQREELWTYLARSFVRHTADLLEEQPPSEEMFGCEENPFDKAMRLPGNKQEIAFKRYKEGKGVASHRDSQEQLYDLYKRISKAIAVEASSYTQSQSMPLVHFGRRFASEDEQKFRYRGIGFQPDGSFGIRTSRHSVEHPVAYKTHPRKFPKFKLALMDRSGSMALSPDNDESVGDKSFILWGDNSKYHYALKGYFGIENFLERQGISQYVKSCVLGYTGEEAVKGDSMTVAKSLLTSPSGGTTFDINGLEKELSSDALVLSISDGELTLTDDVKTRLEEKLKQEGVDFAHIQIGGKTAFSNYLDDIGVPVAYVKGDDDLATTMITFVSARYKSQGGDRK